MKRWLKRAGMTFGVLTLLIVAFYLEENWRGARLWAQTKAQYEAKGFSFDPKSLIPPPVPDELNFAKSEIWQRLLAASDSKNKSHSESALFNCYRNLVKWNKENDKLHPSRSEKKFTLPPEALIGGIETELELLYIASARPECRFDFDYNDPLIVKIPQSHGFASYACRDVLCTHALHALEKKQSEAALKDIKVLLLLSYASSTSPEFTSGIQSCTHIRSLLQVIERGIQLHAWNDAQLCVLQQKLTKIDLLQTCEICYQGQLILEFNKMVDWLRSHRRKAASAISQIGTCRHEYFYESTLSRLLFIVGPDGWYDLAKVKAAHLYIDDILPVADPLAHRIDLSLHKKVLDKLELDSYLPQSLLLSFVHIGTTGVFCRLARSQADLDLAQVACGLERYRLANGKYPATLAELEPKFIDRVPHDLCNGEPLHYRVEADGNYALYSVGFNGVDDGGKVVMKNESLSLIDLKQGDWVWPRSKK